MLRENAPVIVSFNVCLQCSYNGTLQPYIVQQIKATCFELIPFAPLQRPGIVVAVTSDVWFISGMVVVSRKWIQNKFAVPVLPIYHS
jgi:hypothetical protein